MPNLYLREVDATTVEIYGNCRVTKEPHSVKVPLMGYLAWENGELIQNAMPNVSADDREFLISGTSPKGWKKLFGGDT